MELSVRKEKSLRFGIFPAKATIRVEKTLWNQYAKAILEVERLHAQLVKATVKKYGVKKAEEKQFKREELPF